MEAHTAVLLLSFTEYSKEKMPAQKMKPLHKPSDDDRHNNICYFYIIHLSMTGLQRCSDIG